MLSLRSKPSILAALDVYPSELLPQLFLGYDQETVPNNILDVGAGNSHTLEAFAFYRSKVHFLDLFALNLPEQGSSKRQEAYAHRAFGEAFSEVLSDCQGVEFDLCLFWDLLIALPDPALRGLSSALRPWLANQSQGYAVGRLFSDSEDERWRYRIQDAQHLVQLAPAPLTGEAGSAASELPTKHAAGWSQTQFVSDFDCLRIAADRLQPDGRLELLFTSG
jgi:hypothetical protein